MITAAVNDSTTTLLPVRTATLSQFRHINNSRASGSRHVLSTTSTPGLSFQFRIVFLAFEHSMPVAHQTFFSIVLPHFFGKRWPIAGRLSFVQYPPALC